jgi:hypothetical protein
MTADIVSLCQRRKRQAREEADARAAENRARFGRKKAERDHEARESERAKRAHDATKLD